MTANGTARSMHPTRPCHSHTPLDGIAKHALDTCRNRMLVAIALFSLAFAVIGIRLVDLALMADGREPRLAETRGTAGFRMARRDIFDRNGVLLATSVKTASLFADPLMVLDPAETARRLIEVLPELDAGVIRAKLSSERRFEWLRRNLTPRQQYAVNRLGLPGLSFQREERRVYPHGPLTSHVIGFTGVDNRGLAGLERYLDRTSMPEGQVLTLSLDIRIQHVLREELGAAIEEFEALGGAGIAMDIRTGELLAMVSLPDFDPNHPAQARADTRFNRAALGVYEMGSTFKIFTTAMALDTGTVTLDGGYDATRPIRIARFTIRDFHGKRRWLSVPEIFIYSSNIGAAKMAIDVGTERQRDFLGRLGLLAAAPLELPEVGQPMVPNPWRKISTMTIAYGHGIAVSPVQMATAVSAVINGGIMRGPTLRKLPGARTAAGERVVSAQTSRIMRALLRLVVEQGTGRNANVPGYLVGGKTGTAEKTGTGRLPGKIAAVLVHRRVSDE